MTHQAIRIIAVGDLSFNGRYHRLLTRRGPAHPFRAVMPFWSGADLRLGNLESPITAAPRRISVQVDAALGARRGRLPAHGRVRLRDAGQQPHDGFRAARAGRYAGGARRGRNRPRRGRGRPRRRLRARGAAPQRPDGWRCWRSAWWSRAALSTPAPAPPAWRRSTWRPPSGASAPCGRRWTGWSFKSTGESKCPECPRRSSAGGRRGLRKPGRT